MFSNKFYCNNDVLQLWQNHSWSRSHNKKRIVKFIEVDNGIIIQPSPCLNYFGNPAFEVGVFDKNKNYIAGTGMTEMKFVNLSFADNIPYADQKVIYCGALYTHYGHFILQSTARLYYYLENKENLSEYFLVFVVIENKIPNFIKDFFDLCGIDQNKIIYINKTMQFSKVICPDLSSIYYRDFTQSFLVPFQTAAKNIQATPYKKVYFSRKHWTGMAKCLGEDVLEKIFNDNGFHSIEMERLSLREQIAVIKGAEVLAGINGTAFHNILFADKPKKLIMLNRNEEFDSQYIINEAVNADCTVIQSWANPLPVSHPNGPFIVGVTQYVKQFFQDNKFKNYERIFQPTVYARQFWELYVKNYSIANLYHELVFRHKEKIDVSDLMDLWLLASYDWKKKLFWYLAKHLTIGKLHKFCKNRYNELKNIDKRTVNFKY